MAKQKFHAYTFIVEGAGRFPVDMMRYDRCVPRRQNDVSIAFAEDGLLRRVELQGYTPSDNPKPGPTIDRWASFGWSVVRESVQVVQ